MVISLELPSDGLYRKFVEASRDMGAPNIVVMDAALTIFIEALSQKFPKRDSAMHTLDELVPQVKEKLAGLYDTGGQRRTVPVMPGLGALKLN